MPISSATSRPARSPTAIRTPASAITTPVTGGRVKCQWKADWALRWAALGVDYEMSGKDLIDSVTLSSKICRALGAQPPEGFNYELFLDETGGKISKSKGNGLTIDEWLAYASPESLSLFMFQKPKAAKRLHFDVIPRAVDDYFAFLEAYRRQDGDASSSAIRSGTSIPARRPSVALRRSRSRMLLNLASASNTEDEAILWGFISRHCAGDDARDRAGARRSRPLCGALLPRLREARKTLPRARRGRRRRRSRALDARLAALPADADAEAIQAAVYDVGRAFARYQTPPKAEGEKPGVALTWFAHALRAAARPGEGAALRLVRGDLRHSGNARADRAGAVWRTGGGSRQPAPAEVGVADRRLRCGREPACRAASAAHRPTGRGVPPAPAPRRRVAVVVRPSPSPAPTDHSPMSRPPTEHVAASGTSCLPRPEPRREWRGRGRTAAARRAPCVRTASSAAPQRSSARRRARRPRVRIVREPIWMTPAAAITGRRQPFLPGRRRRLRRLRLGGRGGWRSGPAAQ